MVGLRHENGPWLDCDHSCLLGLLQICHPIGFKYRRQTRVDGDRYTILHGDVQIEAVCRYSTYTPRGTDKTDDAHCLSTPPVGRELSGKRGEGDWLFIDWKANDAEWHMGLQ